MSNFRICVQNLALYNAGTLSFRWVDLPVSDEELADICATIARAPRDADGNVTGEGDEITVADVEGFPFKAEEGTPSQYAAWVEALEEHGEPLEEYIEWMGIKLDEDPRATAIDFEESYQGEFSSKEDHAEELFRDVYTIPSYLDHYIDWEKVARDFVIGGDYYYAEKGYRTVYVFRSL